MQHRIFGTSVASVYPHYVAKVEKKGRRQAELDSVIEWLTGFGDDALRQRLEDGALQTFGVKPCGAEGCVLPPKGTSGSPTSPRRVLHQVTARCRGKSRSAS